MAYPWEHCSAGHAGGLWREAGDCPASGGPQCARQSVPEYDSICNDIVVCLLCLAKCMQTVTGE